MEENIILECKHQKAVKKGYYMRNKKDGLFYCGDCILTKTLRG